MPLGQEGAKFQTFRKIRKDVNFIAIKLKQRFTATDVWEGAVQTRAYKPVESVEWEAGKVVFYKWAMCSKDMQKKGDPRIELFCLQNVSMNDVNIFYNTKINLKKAYPLLCNTEMKLMFDAPEFNTSRMLPLALWKRYAVLQII